MAKAPKKAAYKRVLLKLSGEAIQGDQDYGIDPKAVSSVAGQIKTTLSDFPLQLAIVIGGGNIFRGIQAAAEGIDRSTAD